MTITDFMTARISNLTFHPLLGLGHCVTGAVPDEVSRVIPRFIASVGKK